MVSGPGADGPAVLRKIRRAGVGVLRAVATLRCCDGIPHFWGARSVRLIPPAYVKPFVKRQKNDAADAEAICEAAVRPTMRSSRKTPKPMVFRVRELLIRQRTQAINALRGHLTEFGQIVPQGAATIETDRRRRGLDSGIPADAIATLKVLVMALANLDAEIGKRQRSPAGKEIPDNSHPIPGHCRPGPAARTFRGARFCRLAWSGPRQHSTGGKQRLPRRRWVNDPCDAC